MDVPKCECHIAINSEILIDDNNDADDIANDQIVDDIIGYVDNDMAHTQQHDLVTLVVHDVHFIC